MSDMKKRTAGRPKTYPDGGAMIYYRLSTKEEGQRVKAAAAELGLSVSAFTRMVVLEALRRSGTSCRRAARTSR